MQNSQRSPRNWIPSFEDWTCFGHHNFSAATINAPGITWITSKVILKTTMPQHCTKNGYKCINQRMNTQFGSGYTLWIQSDGTIKLTLKSMYSEKLADSSQQFMSFKMTIVVCHFCHFAIFLLFFTPKCTLMTMCDGRWKLPTIWCLCCFYIGFLMFLYDL